ncbi:hypothetical protein NHX12_027918 [Muraenolepis orangiensis]|uniref:Uncharacterized protein n=1 Tax=Muraenolepis orangiensis TaxID=630683 RepID=A0A9Q0IPP8_9TELE|nr:hypothetical protein NHX12_027918 [Muraenolepis orangiensis]
MEKDFQSAPKRFWQTIRRLRRGKRGSIQAVYSKGGTLLTSTEEVIGRCKEDFEELLNPTTPSMVETELEDEGRQTSISLEEVTTTTTTTHTGDPEKDLRPPPPIPEKDLRPPPIGPEGPRLHPYREDPPSDREDQRSPPPIPEKDLRPPPIPETLYRDRGGGREENREPEVTRSSSLSLSLSPSLSSHLSTSTLSLWNLLLCRSWRSRVQLGGVELVVSVG